MANDNASRAYAEITLVRPPPQPTLYERILRPFFPGYVARRIRRRHLFEACEAGLRRYAARPENIAKWDGFDGLGPE